MNSAEMLANVVRYLQSIGLDDATIEQIKRVGPHYVDDAPTIPAPCPPPEVA